MGIPYLSPLSSLDESGDLTETESSETIEKNEEELIDLDLVITEIQNKLCLQK